MNKRKIITNNPPKWHLITGIAATILAGIILTNQDAFAATDSTTTPTTTAPTVHQTASTNPLSGSQITLTSATGSSAAGSTTTSSPAATSTAAMASTSATSGHATQPSSSVTEVASTNNPIPTSAVTASSATTKYPTDTTATPNASSSPTSAESSTPNKTMSTNQQTDGSGVTHSTTPASSASIPIPTSVASMTTAKTASAAAPGVTNSTAANSTAPTSVTTTDSAAESVPLSTSSETSSEKSAAASTTSTSQISDGSEVIHPMTSAISSSSSAPTSGAKMAASAASAATPDTSHATVPASTATSAATTFQITSVINSLASSTYSEYAEQANAEAASAATTAEKPATSVGTVVPTAATTPIESIDTWMPNKHLQEAVLRELQALKLPDHQFKSVNDITKDDMQLLTQFYGENTYIDGHTPYSLEGLQYATNLKTIWLNNGLNALGGYYNGDVTDISPLAGLTKLTVLNIQHNRVSDLSPIAHLTNLQELDVAYNHIADLSVFKDLPNLKTTTYLGQTILEPLVYVDQDTTSATLKNRFYLPNGQQAVLKSQAAILKPVQLTPNGQFYYRFYFNGAGKAVNGDLSNVVPDGQGGLTFNQLVPQIPGFTGDANGQFVTNGVSINVVPNDKNFYLVAQGSDGSSPVFHVFQPYVLAAKAAPVTIHHIDRNGAALRDSEELTGLVGEDYQSTPADITNYTHVETQGAPQGTFSAEPQAVTYVYDKTAGAPVTVSYQDEQGKTLQPDTTCNGLAGDPYMTKPLEIAGYDLTKTPDNAAGTFTAEPQHVIYIYTKQVPQPVTASYQDEDGKALQPDITHTGEIGAAYETKALEIPDYDLVKTIGNATGTFTKEPQQVTYIYTKQIPQPVTASYQDEDGKTLQPDITHTGEIGAAYETKALEIPGYQLIKTPTNATGSFTKEPQHVLYVYEKQAVLPVTVSYQDADGKPLRADIVLSGDFGQNYQTEQLSIPGYVFNKVVGPTIGTFGTTAQHVVYTYTPESSEPEQPTPGPEPEPVPEPQPTPAPQPEPTP
ncbi:MucBP domain-containing protein, partial [Lactiplantibacillus plantarum]|uniref:MucBP domain-containing protein n=1 Tax=Lactiplantibacillus plantarum TaxID=1590 RepID=UPI003EBD82FD